MISLFEPGINGLIGDNAVCVIFGSKGMDKYGIASMEGDHDVMVFTAGVGVKALSVIHDKWGD